MQKSKKYFIRLLNHHFYEILSVLRLKKLWSHRIFGKIFTRIFLIRMIFRVDNTFCYLDRSHGLSRIIGVMVAREELITTSVNK